MLDTIKKINLITVMALAIFGLGYQPASALIIDNTAATFTGTWGPSHTISGYQGSDYAYAAPNSNSTATFDLGSYSGYWTIDLLSPAYSNRATNVSVDLFANGVLNHFLVNQRGPAGESTFSFGSFTLGAGSYLTISALGSDGYVIADALSMVDPPAPRRQAPPVPEPSTLLLLGGGILGLGSFRRIWQQ